MIPTTLLLPTSCLPLFVGLAKGGIAQWSCGKCLITELCRNLVNYDFYHDNKRSNTAATLSAAVSFSLRCFLTKWVVDKKFILPMLASTSVIGNQLFPIA